MTNVNTGSGKPIAAKIVKRPVGDWLQEQYRIFTMYAIYSRALVSDDGLKPVNRRVLWSLFKNGITPNVEHLKVARAAGDTLAYHPHGNASVEDAIARMAQGFAMRVPLIDPYGSVGTVTGDTAAAARYWECRLNPAAMELLKEIPEGGVEMGKNFDGKIDEPSLLPARWPLSIINGTQGIAVGYASNMFSHNPDEVMDALRKLLRNPGMTVKTLLKIMPGPDLPTGGELFGVDGVKEYYETGSGSFIIRGRYTVENLTRGKKRIIFSELPYQVSAEDVMKSIRKSQDTGKFKEIATVKDLTDRKNGMRLVIETKAGTNHLAVINELFKSTPLERKFSVNNTVLSGGSPKVMGMLDLLKEFIEFRKGITVNKLASRADKISIRLHQLKALLAALLDIDKAISIIRKSDSVDIAKQKLMKAFKLDVEQADYILSMQLRRLTRADSVQIQKEHDELTSELANIKETLESEEKLLEVIDKDLKDTKKVITDARRTVITGLTTEEVKEESKEFAQAAREVEKNTPCYVTRFADGRLIRTSEPFSYSATLKKYKYSPIVEQLKMNTHDEIVIITDDGIGHRIPITYISPDIISDIKNIGLSNTGRAKIIGFAKTMTGKNEVGVALGTKTGLVKIAKTDFPTNKNEFPVITLAENDVVVNARWLGNKIENTSFTFISREGNILVFDASTIRVSGSKAGGVRGQKLKNDKDEVIHFNWVPNMKDEVFVLSQSKLTMKLSMLADIPSKNKGGMGVALHGYKKGEKFLNNAYVGSNPIIGVTKINNSVNLPPLTKRAARGVDFTLDVHFGTNDIIIM